jgi:predicted DNA-binding transcriptional regulator YafY
MSQNVPKERRKLGKAVRRERIIALIVEGKAKSNQQIADALGVDEKTIDRDMKSVQIQDFTAGLVKRQIEDIEDSEPGTRLHYRADLLDKLLPKKMGEKVEVNVTAAQTMNQPPIIDLSQLTEDERKALLHAEEALARAETQFSTQ